MRNKDMIPQAELSSYSNFFPVILQEKYGDRTDIRIKQITWYTKKSRGFSHDGLGEKSTQLCS